MPLAPLTDWTGTDPKIKQAAKVIVIWRKAASLQHTDVQSYSLGGANVYPILGSPDSTPKTVSRSALPLLRGLRSRQTDRQTDRLLYSVCSNRPHLRGTAMRPNNTFIYRGQQNVFFAASTILIVSRDLFTLLGLLSPPKPANDYISWNGSRERGFLPNNFCIFTPQ